MMELHPILAMDSKCAADFVRQVKEETFHLMTGHLAPGVDAPAMKPDRLDHDARRALWDLWHKTYGDAVQKATIVACRLFNEAAP